MGSTRLSSRHCDQRLDQRHLGVQVGRRVQEGHALLDHGGDGLPQHGARVWTLGLTPARAAQRTHLLQLRPALGHQQHVLIQRRPRLGLEAGTHERDHRQLCARHVGSLRAWRSLSDADLCGSCARPLTRRCVFSMLSSASTASVRRPCSAAAEALGLLRLLQKQERVPAPRPAAAPARRLLAPRSPLRPSSRWGAQPQRLRWRRPSWRQPYGSCCCCPR